MLVVCGGWLVVVFGFGGLVKRAIRTTNSQPPLDTVWLVGVAGGGWLVVVFVFL